MNGTSHSERVAELPVASGRRRRWWPWILVAVAAMVIAWCGSAAVLGSVWVSQGRTASWGIGNAVGVVYVEGTIGGTTATGGGVDSVSVIEFVRQADANERVKAIVVFINSPGGAVVPSDELYHALLGASKPVVAVMGDIAASGGYYVACGADKILAHPATITGSIGVYGRLVNAADLLDKLGVEGIIIRSGDAKATGNWFEHPTKEQLAIEQAIVDELYELFVGVVADSRGLSPERVRELGDGRPYTGQQALELGLIDGLGSMQDALRQAAEMGGIPGDPEVIEYRREPSLIDLWLGAQRARQNELDLLRWLDEQVNVPQMRYTE